MAVAMRERVARLAAGWRREGYALDLGLGIARGYATLGAIGFEGRWDYAALGTVTNLAARLCGEARAGQILVSARVLAALDELADVEPLGEVSLRGFLRPMPVFSVKRLRR
jgi:class 3 adenylate cyclase